jgi:hypothetical protein
VTETPPPEDLPEQDRPSLGEELQSQLDSMHNLALEYVTTQVSAAHMRIYETWQAEQSWLDSASTPESDALVQQAEAEDSERARRETIARLQGIEQPEPDSLSPIEKLRDALSETAPVPDEAVEVLVILEAAQELLADKLNYDYALGRVAGIDGLTCTGIATENHAIIFSSLADDNVAVILSADGHNVTERAFRIGDNFHAQNFADWQDGLSDEEFRIRGDIHQIVALLAGAPNMSLREVLASDTPTFLSHMFDRMQQTRQWFADCLARGIDPLDDGSWPYGS